MGAPDRQEFLARRREGLGGSDVAAVLGLNPWKTTLQLWMDKTGRSEDTPDPDAQERMHWGNVLEDVVARHYADKHGVKVQRINQQLRHRECPIALANIDRAVLEQGKRARWDDAAGRVLGARNVLECKTAHALAQNSAEWGEPSTDEVPQHYWMQCTWYMGITGLPFTDLAVLFGGQRFVTYTIAFDQALFDDLLTAADDWWKRYVVADMPPPATTEDDARRLWKSHVAGRELIVDSRVAAAVEDLRAIKAQIKDLEEREQAAKNLILPAFEDAEAITHMGRRLATWKQNKASKKTDWEAVAMASGAHPDCIAHHTREIEGSRVLRLAAIKE